MGTPNRVPVQYKTLLVAERPNAWVENPPYML